MPNGKLVVSGISHVGEVLGSKHLMWCKTFAQNVMTNMRIFFNLKKIVEMFLKNFFVLKSIFQNK